MSKLTISEWMTVIKKSPTLKKTLSNILIIIIVVIALVMTCGDWESNNSGSQVSKQSENTNKVESSSNNERFLVQNEWLKYDEYYGREKKFYVCELNANLRDYPNLKNSRVIETLDLDGYSEYPIYPYGTHGDFYVIKGSVSREFEFIHKSLVSTQSNCLFEAYVKKKQLVKGMTKDQVKRAWGKPDSEYIQGNYVSWTYDWHNEIATVTFIDGKYTELSRYKHNLDDY